jgi:hypothetical protein
VLGIQSRAKATISLRAIEKIKSVAFQRNPNTNNNYALGYSALPVSTGHYNTAIGYQTGLSINQTTQRNTITFGNPSNPAVLVITADGDVEWHGKPSEAAEALKRTFQFAVEDMKGITKAARRRYYHRACKNILNKAEKMEHAEFIDFLKKQVYNKERRVIMDSLKYEQD